MTDDVGGERFTGTTTGGSPTIGGGRTGWLGWGSDPIVCS